MNADAHKSPIDSCHSRACFKLFPDPLLLTQKYALAGRYHGTAIGRKAMNRNAGHSETTTAAGGEDSRRPLD